MKNSNGLTLSRGMKDSKKKKTRRLLQMIPYEEEQQFGKHVHCTSRVQL